MNLQSYPAFNPLCSNTLVAMNRESVPSPTGLNCKPCMGVQVDSGCCRSCFQCAFPGISGSGMISTGGSQTFHYKYFTSAGTWNCGWTPFYTYNGNYSSSNTTGISFDQSGTAYWLSTFIEQGGTLLGVARPSDFAIITFTFSTATIISSGTQCNGSTYFGGHPFTQGVYSCSNFTCLGGTFTNMNPGLSGCNYGCCSTTWPSTVTVTGDVCA